MIPHTYPSQLDENNTTQMVVYYLSNVSGLERWKDYIPVKETPLASPELNSFNINGAIYTSALSSIEGKQAWVDYIPVYEDSLATDAWTINAVGYLTTKSEVVAKALAVIASYGTDAHVYLPGIGVINGLTAGNYLDSAGTTAATVDNPVGLVLDGAGSVGAELVVNGDFSNGLAGWTNTTSGTGSATVVSGQLQLYRLNSTNVGKINQAPCEVGKTYKTTFTVISGQCFVSISGNGGNFGVGTYTIYWKSSGNFLLLENPIDASTTIIDNISVKEVTGIHATQGTTANKPILRRGAVNLLLQSQTLNSASWSIAANTSVSTNTTTAPDGTLTADTITFTGQAYFYQPVTTPDLLSTTYTFSIWLWSATGKATIGLRIANNVTGTDATFSLISLTSTPTRYSVTRTFTAAGTSIDIGLENRTIAGGDGITGDVIAWGAQLEQGSTASTYIPTTTAAASSSTGNYWWQFDGSNDSLALGSVPFQMADDHCVIAGFTPYDLTTNRCVIAPSFNSTTVRYAYILTGMTGVASVEWYDGTQYIPHRSSTITVNAPLVVSARRANSTLVSRKNGIQFGSSAAFTTAVQASASTIGNGAHPMALNKTFACVVIKGTVTDADLLILEKFIGSLSGVTI